MNGTDDCMGKTPFYTHQIKNLFQFARYIVLADGFLLPKRASRTSPEHELPGHKMKSLDVWGTQGSWDIRSGTCGSQICVSTDRFKSVMNQCWRGQARAIRMTPALSHLILSKPLCMRGMDENA